MTQEEFDALLGSIQLCQSPDELEKTTNIICRYSQAWERYKDEQSALHRKLFTAADERRGELWRKEHP